MRTARSPSRGRRPSAQRTLLGPAVLGPAALATALVATAAVGVIAGRPVATLSTASQAAIDAKAVVAGKAAVAGKAVVAGKAAAATTAKSPGWRVVAAIGPDNEAVTGTVSAGSAAGAWSVWTGTAFTAVERLQGTRWSRVPLPAPLTAYARSAVAFGGDSATDFWLFNSRSATHALRFAGDRWTLQRIPSWVLQRQSGGSGLSVSAAVFSPRDVWVFDLGAGAYAAHYDGRGWTKVRLPSVPDEVSAVSADDIWALHGNVAWNWNGETWTASRIPRAAGNPPESFGHLSATGPGSAWVWRDVLVPGRPAEVDQLHWNGTSWRRAGAGPPAGLNDSVVPDGSGGLWATGADVNPGGFHRFYHLAGGRWSAASPPAGIWDQQPESLTWIPGTHSVWGTATGLTSKGSHAEIIKYGP
jgi:hypothetical protein